MSRMRPPTKAARANPDQFRRLMEKADLYFEAERKEGHERPLRRPSTTYRLQVHKDFNLEHVTAIVDYLNQLGISDIYLSPFLSARPGSVHGYDVFDYRRINAEVGDTASHKRMVERLDKLNMGRVLDVVPNHMGISGSNPYWMDVLELGKQSPSARFFDIDWKPTPRNPKGRLVLPILESDYGEVLECGKLTVSRDGGRFVILYHDRALPIHPKSTAPILEAHLGTLTELLKTDDPDLLEYRSILDSVRSLPEINSTAPNDLKRLVNERDVLPQRLGRLLTSNPKLSESIDKILQSLRGRPGEPSSFDALHALLEAQIYRLASWRVAAEEINHRRFFDVSELAGIRAEDPKVFEATHAMILEWVEQGGVTGLRIDHPDGLADPQAYLVRLQEHLLIQACQKHWEAEGRQGRWSTIARRLRYRFRDEAGSPDSRDFVRRFPVVAEKILTGDEPLPQDWPIDGTVGYEFLNALNGLFVDPLAAQSLDETYRLFVGDATSFETMLADAKGSIARTSLASEVSRLSRSLERITAVDRSARDFTPTSLQAALITTLEAFPVYRNYVRPNAPITDIDRIHLETAFAQAKRQAPGIDRKVFTFLHDLLFDKDLVSANAEERCARKEFVRRFQQVTGPLQAKGLEDTTFYRYVPLLSLNEVGGEPSKFGVSPEEFHARNIDRLKNWPGGFNTTSTHDTKRGEDARARINLISERPTEWADRLEHWASMNARHKLQVTKGIGPDARDELILYQTLIGSWPFDQGPDDVPRVFIERVQCYVVKAAREAKLKTSWTDPDPSYAESLAKFVETILTSGDCRAFRESFLAFLQPIARLGVVNSLAQTVLKVISPGVADTYQGSELWNFDMVDPDNRRPVDYGVRRELLDSFRQVLGDGARSAESLAAQLIRAPSDGAIKLFVLSRLLFERRSNPDLYLHGDYFPLSAKGPKAEHIVAVERRLKDRRVIAVVPRLSGSLYGWQATETLFDPRVWEGTSIELGPDAPSEARDILTERRVEIPTEGRIGLSTLFSTLPVSTFVIESKR